MSEVPETIEAEVVETPDNQKVVGRLTESELRAMNIATQLLDLARLNMSQIWTPIQRRFELPTQCHYDRANGDILLEEKGDG